MTAAPSSWTEAAPGPAWRCPRRQLKGWFPVRVLDVAPHTSRLLALMLAVPSVGVCLYLCTADRALWPACRCATGLEGEAQASAADRVPFRLTTIKHRPYCGITLPSPLFLVPLVRAEGGHKGGLLSVTGQSHLASPIPSVQHSLRCAKRGCGHSHGNRARPPVVLQTRAVFLCTLFLF